MSKFAVYIRTLRLRTLPLSLSSVIMGMLLAWADYNFSWYLVLLIILGTMSVQIVSNLANELGDSIKGTDRDDRQGPKYGIQSGLISAQEVKRLLIFFVALTILLAGSIIYCSFSSLFTLESILLSLLAISAIMAAIKYTLGSSPYGYKGLGDIFVFIFFGLVGVMASYFVCSHEIPHFYLFLPAVCVGALSTAVLNVNNMRDMISDAKTRVTIPIKLGLKGARIYHTCLVLIAWISAISYCFFRFWDYKHFLFFLTLPLFIIHLVSIWKKRDAELDSSLPFLVLSTFAFSILYGIGFNLFRFF